MAEPSPGSIGKNTPAPAGSWTYAGLLAAGALLAAFRLHAFDLPLENDECNYAYIGQRLLAGDRLYLDVWDHQPFGVFALYAGVIGLFGDAPNVFRWMTAGFALVSLTMVHAILRRTSGPTAAMVGAFFYAIVSADPGTAGEGCNREIYMNALILTAWYLAIIGAERQRNWALLTAGVSLALASSLKTIVAVHWLLLAAWLIFDALRDGSASRTWTRAVRRAGLLAIGPLILWLGTITYFFATERGGEFVDAVFGFNLSYSSASTSFFLRFADFFAPQRHRHIFDSALPLWLAAVPASAWLLYGALRRRTPHVLLMLALLIAGYITVCLPARFWPHYYYLLIPPMVIVVTHSAASVARAINAPSNESSTGRMILSAFCLLLVPLAAATMQYRHYLSRPPFGITIDRYNSRDFWGRAQGENVRRVTKPDDTIFVYGNDAEIYYYARRRCASRFTMITGLQGAYSGVNRRREILMRELQANPPRLIVVLFDEPPFEEWTAFLQRHYGAPVGWDFHDRTGEPIMFVLARRDQPIETIDWNWDRSQVGGWFPGERP